MKPIFDFILQDAFMLSLIYIVIGVLHLKLINKIEIIETNISDLILILFWPISVLSTILFFISYIYSLIKTKIKFTIDTNVIDSFISETNEMNAQLDEIKKLMCELERFNDLLNHQRLDMLIGIKEALILAKDNKGTKLDHIHNIFAPIIENITGTPWDQFLNINFNDNEEKKN